MKTLSAWLRYSVPLFAPEGVGGSSTDPTSSSPGPSTAPSSTPAASAPSTSSTPSGASSPPSATPSESTPSSPDLGFDYSSIFEGPSESPVVVPVQPAAQPGVTAAPAPAAPAAPAGTVVTPPVPPVPPVQPTSGQQDTPSATPSSAGPQYDPADPISLARALQENEAAAIEHVAQTMFVLTPEDIGNLEADVAGTVPKLLAKVMVRAQQQMFTLMSRFVPPMIQRHSVVMKKQSENVDAFYSAWPNLDKVKHGDLVQSYGAMYRKMHPDKSTADMIQDLGKMVSALVGVPIAAAATPKPNGAAPPTPSFVPAQPGSVGDSSPPERGSYDFLGQSE